jgi:hypothetical protein
MTKFDLLKELRAYLGTMGQRAYNSSSDINESGCAYRITITDYKTCEKLTLACVIGGMLRDEDVTKRIARTGTVNQLIEQYPKFTSVLIPKGLSSHERYMWLDKLTGIVQYSHDNAIALLSAPNFPERVRREILERCRNLYNVDDPDVHLIYMTFLEPFTEEELHATYERGSHMKKYNLQLDDFVDNEHDNEIDLDEYNDGPDGPLDVD